MSEQKEQRLKPGEQPYDGMNAIRIGILVGGISGIAIGFFTGGSIWLLLAGAAIGGIGGAAWYRRDQDSQPPT